MVVYSIKDLENLSGVKAHTLRIWEKRYDLIQPKRTKTNIRYYTDEDVRKLLNVCFLYKKGYKISKIGQMDEDQLKAEVSQHSKANLSFEDQLDALMIFILELDTYNFNKILDQHISQKGMDETMTKLIYPLLDKLSMAWMTSSFLEVHESYVVQVIKSKLLACTEQLEEQPNCNSSYLIYLPLGQDQELSMLYLHFLLKKAGSKVTNLGNNIKLSDVLFAVETCKPDHIFTIINQEMTGLPLQQYIDELSKAIGDKKLLLTGYQTLSPRLKWPENVKLIKDLAETKEYIATHCSKTKS